MIEQRNNLLGSWAIHCDTPDCHIEVLGIDEDEVQDFAKADGWKLDGQTHLCTDCAAGVSPKDIIAEGAPEPVAATQPRALIPSTPDHVDAFDDDDDDVTKDAKRRMNQAEAAVADMQTREREPFIPFDERSGATVPEVVARAEDLETPSEKEARLRREKRARERREKARKESKESKEKTLAAMGGVEKLLGDFDGMFGGNNTWDD